MPGKRIFNAFFSYAHLDARATPHHVEPLAIELENIVTARLVNAGFLVWREVTRLRTGDRWNTEIESRLRSSDIMIVLFSPGWIGSDYCRKEYAIFEEVEAGYGGGEFVVPILLRPIDGDIEYLNDEQRVIYDRLRERQFFPKLAVGGTNRRRAIEEVAGHIVRMLRRRRNSAIAAEVSAEEGAPLPVLQGILGKLDDADTPDDDAIEQQLDDKAEEYGQLQELLKHRSTDGDERIVELRRDAGRLIGENDFIGADAALSQAETRDVEAIEELEAIAKRRRISAAASRAGRAAAARLQLDYRTAAMHYAEAASILPAEEAKRLFQYNFQYANALGDAGRGVGDNDALREAVAIYKRLLSVISRTDMPGDWAKIQNNLGNALSDIGEGESGTARLEEAITAYTAALEEWTHERVPRDWARTQNNLGTALEALGRHEIDTVRRDALLEKAAAAYRAALQERSREDAPLAWATTQNNLADALSALGDSKGDIARLKTAVAIYGTVLEERTRERVPLDWATTQNNLGIALRWLAKHERGTKRLEEAVEAYRAALTERRRERVPLAWAKTQSYLAVALQALGEQESDPNRLREAIAAYDMALEVFDTAHVDYDIELTQKNREQAMESLARLHGGRRS